MADFVLVRATLMRSNPQYIRELEIPADCSWDNLHQYLQIACGRRKKNSSYTFRSADEIEKAENEPFLPGQKFWYEFDGNSGFCMRVEVVGKIERTEEDPYAKAVMMTGKAVLNSDITTTSEFNEVQAYLEADMTYYRASYRIEGFAKQKMDLDSINDRIKRTYPREHTDQLIDTGILQPDIIAFPRVNKFFNTESKEELFRLYCEIWTHGYYYSYYSRSDFLHMISNVFDESRAVMPILLGMGVDEMNAFMELCSGEIRSKRIECFPVLREKRLVKESPDGKLTVPYEFAKTAVSLIQEDTFEDLYCAVNALRVVLIAGCMLYGGCDRGTQRTLLERHYPSVFVEDFEKTVNYITNSTIEPELQVGAGGFVVIPENFRLTEAKKLTGKNKYYPKYQPSLEEIKRMAEHGYGFTDEQKNKIKGIVNTYVEDANPTEYLYQQLDHLIRKYDSIGPASKYLVDVIKENSPGNPSSEEAVNVVMSTIYEDFRLPSLNGNTPREVHHV